MQTLTISDLVQWIETKKAPLSLAESYDNPGLLVGRGEKPLQRVMVAVDASEHVLEQAVQAKVDLLFVHHPTIFVPIKSVTDRDRNGRRLLTLIENHIALYCAHTNLDAAPGGNIDMACRQLGLEQITAVAEKEGGAGCLRMGILPKPLALREVAELVKARFSLPQVRMYGPAERSIQRVALCTGSGMDFAQLALQEKADLFVTGDITYHKADDALAEGLCLIDATHFGTDRLSNDWICDMLSGMAEEQEAELLVIKAEEPDLYETI